jgi:sugar phosphate isomerase/epimerase
MNRRSTLKNMAALPFLGGLSNRLRNPGQVSVFGKQRLKSSLNAYSFNAPLMARTMDVFDLLRWCADMGFDAVDITGYYFEGYPEVPAPDYLYRIKRTAHALGIEISGTGVRNDFSIPDKALREKEKERVLNWINVAADLGAPVLRIFAGAEKKDGYSREQIREWMLEDIYQCVTAAQSEGVIIGLQNHNDFILTSDHVIDFMKAIPSPWFGLILDTGSYRKENPYTAIEKTIEYAVNWQIKELIFVDGKEVETDIPLLFNIIRKSNYSGYLPIETLGAGDPKVKIPVLLEKVMKEMK